MHPLVQASERRFLAETYLEGLHQLVTALEQGIPAGARGSACGAIVSYVLNLSHVNPLDYDLLFERFLDPNRNEAPDIGACLDGARAQDYPGLEIVVVDDRSEDGTGEIVRRAASSDPRVKLVEGRPLCQFVPACESCDDYPLRMFELLSGLAEFEDRQASEVIDDILRLAGDAPDGAVRKQGRETEVTRS